MRLEGRKKNSKSDKMCVIAAGVLQMMVCVLRLRAFGTKTPSALNIIRFCKVLTSCSMRGGKKGRKMVSRSCGSLTVLLLLTKS